MDVIRSVIGSSLHRLVERELGATAWRNLELQLQLELNEGDGTVPDVDRLQRMTALAATRLKRNRSALLLELGLEWWSSRQPTTTAPDQRRTRIKQLKERLRVDEALDHIGLVAMPDDERYPVKGVLLHHTKAVAGCRSFVFGVLHGVGRSHRIPVDVRLLEPHELNGHADIIALDIQ